MKKNSVQYQTTIIETFKVGHIPFLFYNSALLILGPFLILD